MGHVCSWPLRTKRTGQTDPSAMGPAQVVSTLHLQPCLPINRPPRIFRLWNGRSQGLKVSFGCPMTKSHKQGGPGAEPEPETGTVGTVFPGTERGTRTAGTVFQEPKPEPSSLC